ncbi:DTW domain-containing protein [Marinobacter sp. EhC06]|uniref:tRNA-uridine aminocarboxypropyltransferase n=1 Tax=Marinobacter TaxID=2742 RepID=UPI0007DA389B|nr:MULTISPECIES: tRNA-uridine aminocarboxypropyltransferase [unclassified Marinobacter]OAN88139.1 DTW domain-containing protein [Marinobacter sp. EhN04]OAN91122.1 DTW domain-containing protein [Marinobacter sp. EhC06]
MPRPICADCGMHRNICVCEACAPVPNRTRVSVLQHPTEVGHPKGTVRILCQSLKNLEVFCGETPEDFREAGFETDTVTGNSALLFPGPGSDTLESSDLSHIDHWMILDGTWRKAARILHQNPALASLPRFHFASPPASAYTIRKAPGSHHLATAEAVAYLLNVVEPGLDTRPISRAMRTLVDKQFAQIPARLHKHYQ